MKKILILGGTNFIGRNLVERLLELKEYDITLFNRQLTHPNLFSGVKKIKGDRETPEIKQIEGENWNYIIDLSCYFPNALKSIFNSIKAVDKYIYISTCSVYDNESNQTILRNEQSKILDCNSEQKTDENPETYGNRKAECERQLMESGIAYTILRPALVFGNYDPTDRLYYWLYQVKKMNVLLLPESGERIFSTTYVNDLVETIVQSLVQNTGSQVFNVITNPTTSIKQIVDFANDFFKSKYSIVNAPAKFLKENDIAQWTDMPLWINGDFFTYSNQKLKKELGISLTDFKTGINRTIGYYDKLKWPIPKYGMTEIKRQELIEKIKTTANKV